MRLLEEEEAEEVMLEEVLRRSEWTVLAHSWEKAKEGEDFAVESICLVFWICFHTDIGWLWFSGSLPSLHHRVRDRFLTKWWSCLIGHQD